jgi:hypothetical protein
MEGENRRKSLDFGSKIGLLGSFLPAFRRS